MNRQEITEAIKQLEIGEYEDFEYENNDCSVIRTGKSKWSVLDNGEEVECSSPGWATKIVMENIGMIEYRFPYEMSKKEIKEWNS